MRRDSTVIRFGEDGVKKLTEWTRRGTNEHRMVERARIILWAHQGKTTQHIAEQLQTRTAHV